MNCVDQLMSYIDLMWLQAKGMGYFLCTDESNIPDFLIDCNGLFNDNQYDSEIISVEEAGFVRSLVEKYDYMGALTYIYLKRKTPFKDGELSESDDQLIHQIAKVIHDNPNNPLVKG